MLFSQLEIVKYKSDLMVRNCFIFTELNRDPHECLQAH